MLNIEPRRFRLICLQKLIILFPPSKYDFNNSVSLKAFASQAATSAVILGHCGNDLQFSIDCTFRASVSLPSALRKLINAVPFFPHNSGRGASQGDWPCLRTSHQLNPALQQSNDKCKQSDRSSSTQIPLLMSQTVIA